MLIINYSFLPIKLMSASSSNWEQTVRKSERGNWISVWNKERKVKTWEMCRFFLKIEVFNALFSVIKDWQKQMLNWSPPCPGQPAEAACWDVSSMPGIGWERWPCTGVNIIQISCLLYPQLTDLKIWGLKAAITRRVTSMAGLEYEAVPQDIMAVEGEVVGSCIHHRSLFTPLTFIQIILFFNHK